MIVSIHTGMVRDAAIIERVLNELEPRQTDGIQRQMVRAAGVLDGDGGRTLVAEGRQPGFKQRAHRIVPLQVDAANLAAAVIQIEVARELGVVRQKFHGFGIAEMLLHVGLRAK